MDVCMRELYVCVYVCVRWCLQHAKLLFVDVRHGSEVPGPLFTHPGVFMSEKKSISHSGTSG